MSHPLLELANEPEIKQVKGFAAAAAALTVDDLAARFEGERAAAPRRSGAGKRYLTGHDGTVQTGRRKPRDEELLAAALWRFSRDVNRGLPLPNNEGYLEPVDYLVPLRARREDTGPAEIPLLAIVPEDRLAVVVFKFVPPSAPRTSGATPLRLLLEGLAVAAAAAADREALQAEVEEATGRSLADAPPGLVVCPTLRYWEICRKRGPQRGAHWIKELERLAGELDEKLAVPVRYLGLRVEAEPVWEVKDDGPQLVTDARLMPAWELGAGRIRPKARPKPKQTPADTVVKADPDRPPRPYSVEESYQPGDTIDHPTLGRGVVQLITGPGKMQVLFDEDRRSTLIHERERS